jgi:isoleucyl-tRNA synthetase
MALVLEARAELFAQLEGWRQENGVKDTQDVEADLSVSVEQKAALESLGDELIVLFKLADLKLTVGDFKVSFRKSTFEKCDRSRLRRADVEQVALNGETFNLTARDRRALGV